MSEDAARKRWARLRAMMRDPKMRKRLRAYAAAASDPEHRVRLDQEIAALDRGERPTVPEALRPKYSEN
jgi:hypothetical protein